ncbi:MAG: J domain-containing protein [Treponema sp.]|jgi:DnaJ like chaperone protein|nr:J domain-containing protein [Treponema sp.]
MNIRFPGILKTLRQKIRGLPKPVQRMLGPLWGGLFGLWGAVPGVIIGILLGYFVQELFRQSRSDQETLKYFENPGLSGFYEGEPGLAAFCALGIIILAQEAEEDRFSGSGEALIEEISRLAAALLSPGLRQKYSPAPADFALAQYFCALAYSRWKSLNPELLGESLAARRRGREDLPVLGRALTDLASGNRALETARCIRLILDPLYRAPADRDGGREKSGADPWHILGLSPGAPQEKIKSRFRSLAARFHPDRFQARDEEQQRAAAEAFIVIKDAYARLMNETG